MKPDSLTASLEDYLEAIFHIEKHNRVARSKEISQTLSVNRSSVTGALKTLSDKGLVNYTPYDVITLTPKGKARARSVVRRHEALRDFFVKVLGVDENHAQQGACGMEHALPPAILEKLVRYVEFLDLCPRGRDEWVTRFNHFCEHGEPAQVCAMCSARARPAPLQQPNRTGERRVRPNRIERRPKTYTRNVGRNLMFARQPPQQRPL